MTLVKLKNLNIQYTYISIIKKKNQNVNVEKMVVFAKTFDYYHHKFNFGALKSPLPKIWLTYPTMMTLGTVIPYLKKIQKIYKSRDTPLEFCWYQHFFTENQQILL